MAVLRWRHGTSASEAKKLMQQHLSSLGHGDKVKWQRYHFSASVGFGAILSLRGTLTDEDAMLEKCGGAVGGPAMKEIRKILNQLFPGGEMA